LPKCHRPTYHSTRGGEQARGPSLIPDRYTRFDTSGLSLEIKAGMPPLEISLSSQ
jgi:hypothetical protein